MAVGRLSVTGANVMVQDKTEPTKAFVELLDLKLTDRVLVVTTKVARHGENRGRKKKSVKGEWRGSVQVEKKKPMTKFCLLFYFET